MKVDVTACVGVMEENFNHVNKSEQACILMHYLYAEQHFMNGIRNPLHRELIVRAATDDQMTFMHFCSKLAVQIVEDWHCYMDGEDIDDAPWFRYEVAWEEMLEPFMKDVFKRVPEGDDLPW